MKGIENNLEKKEKEKIDRIKVSELNQEIWDNILNIYKNVVDASEMKLKWAGDVEKLKEGLQKNSIDYRLGSGKLATPHSKLKCELVEISPEGDRVIQFKFFGNVDENQKGQADVLRKEFQVRVEDYLTSLKIDK
ncbi:hypothetical protein HY967_00065 [Candidatus Jorgensenbacteria bacterium]|nr:hypothetical protein [Candidatus Jorgensenbacteria bacterium]